MIICISIKMQMLFEHSVCFFSLAATRYITSRQRRAKSDSSLESRDQDNVSLHPTASHREDESPETLSESLQSNTKKMTRNINSFRQPSAVYLSEDSQHSSYSVSQSLQDLAIRGSDTESVLSFESPVRSPVKAQNLSPNNNMEEEVDEWGHFADIHDDTQSKRSDSFDPFRSITKTMMRKRGQPLSSSLCRLSKLQENILEEEIDEDDEE